MKIFNKYLIVTILVVSLLLTVFGFSGPSPVFAATAVDLGTAADYAILAGTGITNTGISTIVGDIGSSAIPDETGLTPCGAGNCINLTGTNHNDPNPNDAATVSAKAALVAAYNNAVGQTPTTNYGAIYDLAPVAATLTPGVYHGASSLGITGKLTLDAQGDPDAVFIFQAQDSTLITETNSEVILTNGAQACNIFWQVGSSATLKTGSIFKGNILALESISLGSGANVAGRLLARDGAVTLIANTITKATCAAASAPTTEVPLGGAYYRGTINVVKIVINDNGGTKTVADFPLFINGTSAVSGTTYTFSAPAPAFTVTETNNANYTRTFSGDCDMNGQFNLNPGSQKFCIVTNDDIGAPVVAPSVPPLIDVVVGAPIVPPLIHITNIPSPLTLPVGGGMVTYTKIITNPGTVALSNVQLTDDECNPVNYISGDTNDDSKLDPTEAWTYTCQMNLTKTTSHTVTVSSVTNGLTARDFAIATVVVSARVPGQVLGATTPALPNTGFPPEGEGILWDIVILAGIFAVLIFFYFVRRKQILLAVVFLGFALFLIFNLPNEGPVRASSAILVEEQVISGLPVRLKIPGINVDAAVEHAGLTSNGEMGAPEGSINVAWFELGPQPGENGSAVIAGHYGWKNGKASVFDNLYKLRKGDKLYIEDSEGVIVSFVVYESRSYDPNADASDVFNSNDGKSHLNLITCEGVWDEVSRTYSQRLVVFTDKE